MTGNVKLTISDGEIHVAITKEKTKEVTVRNDSYGFALVIPSVDPERPVCLLDLFYEEDKDGFAEYRLVIWSPTRGDELLALVEFHPGGTVVRVTEEAEEICGRSFRLGIGEEESIENAE